MTRDEYLIVLKTESATSNQVGAIHRQFARLGVGDRAERLAICAALLGLDELGSTTHLVMGQAGHLVGILRQARERADLPAVVITAAEAVPDDEDQEYDDEGQENRVTLIDAIMAVLAAVALWETEGASDCATVQVSTRKVPPPTPIRKPERENTGQAR